MWWLQLQDMLSKEREGNKMLLRMLEECSKGLYQTRSHWQSESFGKGQKRSTIIYLIRAGFESSGWVGNALISMYCKFASVEDAPQVLDKLCGC
jgi:hypothetical protein